eukprot:TRINITY_DN2886_c0_g1_i1.p1 TRINITY_DN2886_c0_g1~~TRINITY_DN2886_c0_g1_i1.p1  ORF type:complete len:223 (+),score=33.62 TRINITY_DN2886_c0_g1_i1:102-770(+)
MTANPALVETLARDTIPAPFPGESILLQRKGINIDINGVRTSSGKWQTRGVLYLTTVRMVFVAEKTDQRSGLAAFDLPLVYLQDIKFNQPILGANNLSGEVWPAIEGGGPAGTYPPHGFKLYFKEGGVGTFLPLFFRSLQNARVWYARTQQQQQQQQQQPTAQGQEQQEPENMVATAFVDPNDPTRVFLTQPVDESCRLPVAPVYAANYGQPETYEPMGLRP